MSRLRLTVAVLAVTSALSIALPGQAWAEERPVTSKPTGSSHHHLTAHQRHQRHLHFLHLLRAKPWHPPLASRSAVRHAPVRHVGVRHVHHVRHVKKVRPAPRQYVSGVRARILAAAKSYIGVPYRHAGASRGGVDCSGLTMAVYRTAGISIPRTVDAQRRAARYASPKVGDLLFYGTYHVAIVAAVRNGRVTDTIVARHTGTLVQHQAPYESYTVGAVV